MSHACAARRRRFGAYQAGAYEGLAKQFSHVSWVAGISIGAINAAIIAGNTPQNRPERLREFWEQASSKSLPATLLDGIWARAFLNHGSTPPRNASAPSPW